MVNSKGKTTCALIKLVSRVDGHRATITEDFQVMKVPWILIISI